MTTAIAQSRPSIPFIKERFADVVTQVLNSALRKAIPQSLVGWLLKETEGFELAQLGMQRFPDSPEPARLLEQIRKRGNQKITQ